MSMQRAIARLKKPSYRYQLAGLLFVLPVFLGTLVLNVLPTVASLGLSLTSWDLITPPEYVGFQNYARLAQDPFARAAMFNTVKYVIGAVSLGMLGSLGLALLVNQSLRGVRFFRLAYFIPVVTSVVATALVWQWILNGKLGLVNSMLRMIGIDGPSWLTDPRWAMFSIIIISVWAGVGYNMMIFLAGLQNIPQSLYEAATIDGAGGWARFRNVTLPLLSPTTFFVLIISLINSFQVFDIVYIITTTGGAGGRLRSTDVWVYYLWQNAFSFFRMGYASAMAWVLFLVIGAITIFQWKFSKRWVFYD
jgi:multiple sugar transport system permease protein